MDKNEQQKYGRFLSNTHDYRRPDAERMHIYSHYAMSNGLDACKREWEQHLAWINENVIGPPESSDFYTVEELEQQGMIGIYKPIDKQ